MSVTLVSALILGSINQQVSTTPAHRMNEDWWKARHEASVALTKKGGVDIVFLGDSITQGWEGAGKAVWDRDYAPLNAANFGFSGDRTEHVIWRLQNGEMIGLNPKLVIIMIGTNNIGHGSSDPTQTATGVRVIVDMLQKGLPESKILVLNIFPRGPEANDPMRLKVADASSQFQDLCKRPGVTCLDIGYAFIRSDGSLRSKLLPDFLHLTPDGYEIWSKAMKPTVDKLLKN